MPGMVVQVKVKPNSSRPRIETQEDGSLIVYLKSAPVEGKANRELINCLARHYKVPKSQVRIKSGLASKAKFVEIG